MGQKTRKEKRDNRIFKDFKKMFNKDGLRIDVIHNRLGEVFFLAPDTIQKIVLKEARKEKSGNVSTVG